MFSYKEKIRLNKDLEKREKLISQFTFNMKEAINYFTSAFSKVKKMDAFTSKHWKQRLSFEISFFAKRNFKNPVMFSKDVEKGVIACLKYICYYKNIKPDALIKNYQKIFKFVNGKKKNEKNK